MALQETRNMLSQHCVGRSPSMKIEKPRKPFASRLEAGLEAGLRNLELAAEALPDSLFERS